MSDPHKPKARPPRGFADRSAAEIRGVKRMLERIEAVYERYGFEPVETPFVEYTDALGKFLPDQDRPNEGVFSFQDDDEQWLSLRYDLTAPLARYVAENFDKLPKPYRSYRQGWVFRNEKPGPGRFRQFLQFDADTVGAASVAADAEICMMAADAIEAAGVPRGSYVVKVNNRKVLDGVMEAIGVSGEGQRLAVLRAIDKLDKFGPEGVRLLLGPGRKDESGDFTKGAGLSEEQAEVLIAFMEADVSHDPSDALVPRSEPALQGMKGGILVAVPSAIERSQYAIRIAESAILRDSIKNLDELRFLVEQQGYGEDRIITDFGVVRGLEYYTGPVFEVELTFPVTDEDGREMRFGSVGGGGRYDGLVGRFRSEPVPATGFSVGVSRLAAALKHLGKLEDDAEARGPVVVLVLDKDRKAEAMRHVQALRAGGLAAEMYMGDSGLKAQMRYADRRGSPCVVIQGSDERERGVVQVKDLVEGAKAAAAIQSNEEWRQARPAQFECTEGEMVAKVAEIVARHRG
jgi:histidyl-tRNA synthetase